MLEPWNNTLLAPPPVNTFLCKNSSIDLGSLVTTLEDIKQVLSNQTPLHQEGAIMSRLIYKFDKKFRNDIGYHNFKKVNTALKRYLKLNLIKDVENFAVVVPAADSDEDYLPTKQMLQYVLVRIISFTKILVRVVVCAKTSAIFYWDRVTRGESHWMSLMPYAVMSRIWSLCSVLLKQACKWYTRLYQYLDVLESVGVQFLPNGYSLPDDIELWLDVNNIDEHGKFHWSKNRCTQVLSCLEEDDNVEAIDIFQYVKNITNEESSLENNEEEAEEIELTTNNEVNKEAESEEKEFPTHNQNNKERKLKRRREHDFGEVISRESFREMTENPANKAKQKSSKKELTLKNNEVPEKKVKLDNKAEIRIPSHSVDSISDVQKLKLFMAKEERLRNNGNEQSLSSHLSFMQWQSLKMAVTDLYNVGCSDKILKKFRKIWKNKCMAYL